MGILFEYQIFFIVTSIASGQVLLHMGNISIFGTSVFTERRHMTIFPKIRTLFNPELEAGQKDETHTFQERC